MSKTNCVGIAEVSRAWGVSDPMNVRVFLREHAKPVHLVKLGRGIAPFYEPHIINTMRGEFDAAMQARRAKIAKRRAQAIANNPKVSRKARDAAFAEALSLLAARVEVLERERAPKTYAPVGYAYEPRSAYAVG